MFRVHVSGKQNTRMGLLRSLPKPVTLDQVSEALSGGALEERGSVRLRSADTLVPIVTMRV